jgi:uncharacterized protein (DUF2252 family)
VWADKSGIGGPREIDPLVRVAPYIIALHDRDRLLIDDRGAHLPDLRGHIIADHCKRVSGIGDVVGDQDPRRLEIDERQWGREDHGKLQSFSASRVVLDVHDVEILDTEGVGQRPGYEESTAGDRQNQIGLESVIGDHECQVLGRTSVKRPCQHFEVFHGLRSYTTTTARHEGAALGTVCLMSEWEHATAPDSPSDRHRRIEPAIHPGSVLPTRPERTAAGRAGRLRARRSSHGEWSRPHGGPGPIEILSAQNESRYPELIPLRWGRMVASPFTFFRGSAAVMASDLAGSPDSGLVVQACGDAHLQNFGLFASPERNLLFDVNDFDETLPGPWEWDVKRLAASVVLAGRSAGLSEVDSASATYQCVASYRAWMAVYAQMSQLDLWYSRVDIDSILSLVSGQSRRSGQRLATKARKRTTIQAVGKLTAVVDGQLQIVDDPPLVEHISDADSHEAVVQIVDHYRETLNDDRRHLFDRFELVDTARKVVGVGSVGTHCHIALCSADPTDSDPLLLQVKEATRSVLEPFMAASLFPNHGQRVVVGQRLMQAASDLFLGWTSLGDRHFYVRQLRDMKGSVDLTAVQADALGDYASICGWTLARSHARTGDPVAISSYLGGGDSFDRALVSFSQLYADQAEADHALLRSAIDSGRIEAQEGI